MSDEKGISRSGLSPDTADKLTSGDQMDYLQKKLERAELKATDKNIALIEMTAARNALYKSLQETQLRLADAIGQRENDIEAYQKELELRLQEKRQLQEQYDAVVIKAKRYDELQESLIKIKMDAEIRAHSVVDEAQEKAFDTVMLIDEIESEIKLFKDDLVYLRRDIKIGTLTLDDRLENVYLRLCKSLDKLTAIRDEFYIKNSLPFDMQMSYHSYYDDEKGSYEGAVPSIAYPSETEPPEINYGDDSANTEKISENDIKKIVSE